MAVVLRAQCGVNGKLAALSEGLLHGQCDIAASSHDDLAGDLAAR
jgi:hypothetical protein